MGTSYCATMRLSILIFICAICTTTVSSGFDCDKLCQGVPDNEYVSDGCCNSKYCMCYGNVGYEEDCKTPDILFCQSSGNCVENCQSLSGCCDQNPTTTTPQTTTTPLPDPDCEILCQGVEDGVQVSNGCCTPKFCWCFLGAWLTECKDFGPPGNLFCKSTQACVEPENCHSTPDCCDNSPQTTTETTSEPIMSTTTISSTIVAHTTTTLPDPDCDILCQGVEYGVQVSNGCCTHKF